MSDVEQGVNTTPEHQRYFNEARTRQLQLSSPQRRRVPSQSQFMHPAILFPTPSPVASGSGSVQAHYPPGLLPPADIMLPTPSPQHSLPLSHPRVPSPTPPHIPPPIVELQHRRALPVPQPAALPLQQLPAARMPYAERRRVKVNDLGGMTLECPSCQALHWKDERLSKSTIARPKFGMCYRSGKVQIPLLPQPPKIL